MPASFLGLNDGSPILPMAGGTIQVAQQPYNRAPPPEVFPAGYGPILNGMFWQITAMTSPPPIRWPGVHLQNVRAGDF